MHQSLNIKPQGRGKQGDFTLNLGHFLVKFFTQGGKTDVKDPFPGGTYILFDLRWYMYGGIITHSFITCKLHLKQSGKVPQPVL